MAIAKEPEDILTWDIEQLWNAINTIEGVKDDYKQLYQKIKWGFRLKCRITYLFPERKWYEEFANSGRVNIQGHGKFKINDFIDEVEKREETMRKILYENWEIQGPGEARIQG